MLQKLVARPSIWKDIFLSPAIKVFLAACGIIRFLEWADSKLPPNWREKLGNFMIPHFAWQSWTIFILVGLIILILESEYRLISQKEEESRKKEEELNNQINTIQAEISNLLKEQNEAYIPLSEAVEKLRQSALQGQTKYGYSIGSIAAIQTNADEEFDRLAKLLAEQGDIYGKRSSQSFKKWIIIPQDVIRSSILKNMASELWLTSTLYANYDPGGPAYIDLAIKQDGLDRVIEEILSSETIYQG